MTKMSVWGGVTLEHWVDSDWLSMSLLFIQKKLNTNKLKKILKKLFLFVVIVIVMCGLYCIKTVLKL